MLPLLTAGLVATGNPACRHTWDSPVCINNTRKAEQEPGSVHRHTPVGLEGMSLAAAPPVVLPGRWCQPVGTPCTPSPSPALAFPFSAGLLEPKSSKPENHDLGVGTRAWDAARCEGTGMLQRKAVTVWMGRIKSQQTSKVQDGGTAP